ncbi:MAG: hypothetical protein FVQ77_07365 [Cytophagales bacterium]|nr:hypothetical protein [Cytophagales bacterium]
MKTLIVNVPDKKENYLRSLLKKHRFKSRVLPQEEDEDLMAKWIDEGMESEEVPIEKIYEYMRKNGVDC